VELALSALPELGEQLREALRKLLPGGVTVLVGNPAGRFPLACGADPETLGLRVPVAPLLAGVRRPVLQSSANRAGGPDPRSVQEIPELVRSAVDLVIDGGELPGTPSTVVDLRRYEETGQWQVIRAGAVSEDALGEALGWQFHFDPSTYVETIRAEVVGYDRLQDELVAASGAGARRILELGTGTGETALRLLARHPGASLVGIDVNPGMLAAAGEALPDDRVELRVGRLQDALPSGPFDLVASALCIHHLDGSEKADLFRRVGDVLEPGGRFVIGDVVEPVDPADARTPLTPGYDKPSTLQAQLEWLADAGFEASKSWSDGDLAVILVKR
jgi:tRNA (cmo5U34)-methyltransferase